MKETKLNLTSIIVALIIIGSTFFICYVEEEYNVTKFLWVFNIIMLIITPLYYCIHNNREKRKTKKQEDKIIIKNIDFKYYRDLIEEYSPATLSFILDGVEFDKDLAASIIYLLNEGYLELQEENKVIRTSKDCRNLSKDLQLLCNSDINNLLAFRKIKTKDSEEKSKHVFQVRLQENGGV